MRMGVLVFVVAFGLCSSGKAQDGTSPPIQIEAGGKPASDRLYVVEYQLQAGRTDVYGGREQSTTQGEALIVDGTTFGVRPVIRAQTEYTDGRRKEDSWSYAIKLEALNKDNVRIDFKATLKTSESLKGIVESEKEATLRVMQAVVLGKTTKIELGKDQSERIVIAIVTIKEFDPKTRKPR